MVPSCKYPRLARADIIIVCSLPLAKNAVHSPVLYVLAVYHTLTLDTRFCQHVKGLEVEIQGVTVNVNR